MHSNGHVRFGGRAGETGREQSRYCAPARPYWRIQRHRKRGTNQHYIYTYPSRKALRAVMAKVKMWCRQVDTNQPLDVLLARVNPLLKGSLGVLELLHDMVFERFTERFCNTSATRGACCRRCSEPC